MHGTKITLPCVITKVYLSYDYTPFSFFQNSIADNPTDIWQIGF